MKLPGANLAEAEALAAVPAVIFAILEGMLLNVSPSGSISVSEKPRCH